MSNKTKSRSISMSPSVIVVLIQYAVGFPLFDSLASCEGKRFKNTRLEGTYHLLERFKRDRFGHNIYVDLSFVKVLQK
jgi:hypothetical protein